MAAMDIDSVREPIKNGIRKYGFPNMAHPLSG
jgi:hypothetical protein